MYLDQTTNLQFRQMNYFQFLVFYRITKYFRLFTIQNNEEICVVQGPIVEPRNIEDEMIYHIANNTYKEGCEVNCHGFGQCTSPKWGELGEVRDI